MVRRQFEDWLATVADDNDIARAERMTLLFERSEFTRQKDLADVIDVELRTIQRWLAGGSIKKTYWTSLADALGTTVQFLIFGEANAPDVDPSQLDRIEAKLDDILTRLDAANITPRRTAAEIVAAEADRLSDTPTKAPRAPRKQPRTDQAA